MNQAFVAGGRAIVRLFVVLAAVVTAALPDWVGAGQPVVGQIVVEGDVPPPAALPPGRDVCCQEAAPIDESVVVGESGGLANVVVTVETRRGEPKLPTSVSPQQRAVMTNEGCAFRPRVLLARVGQTLSLENADPTMHNVGIAMVRNRSVNVVVQPDGRREIGLTRPERKPVAVRCNVHTFMKGWIVVRDDDYAAVTDKQGRFELPKLPPGEWRFRFWHEGQPLVGVKVGKSVTDDRGQVMVTLPGTRDAFNLGQIVVDAERLR